MPAPAVDWSDWSFGPGRHPGVGATLAGATTLSVTMLAALFAVPPWWMLLASLVMAVAGAVGPARRHAPRQVLLYRAGCWAGAGVWAAATLAVSLPWSRWPLLTLATGTTVAAVVGRSLAAAEKRLVAEKAEKAKAAAEAQERAAEEKLAREGTDDPTGQEWQQRIRDVTRKAVVVTGVEWWTPRTGFTLRGILPGDGTTVGDLKVHESSLAAAANLPNGCGAEILGDSAGRRYVRVRVMTEDALGKTEYLPRDTSPRSINDDIRIGFHSDRTEAAINLRYTCGVLIGQTGSGKSNQLNVITYGLARCTDAVLWAIDLSGGGRYPRPWVTPWVEGRAPRPIFDWVANGPEEAGRLTSAAVAVINGRTGAYQRLMRQANEDKLPVSVQVPQIVIVVDEFGTLPEPVKDLIKTISDTGRGAAVRVLSCALEATVAYLPPAVLKQARVRIGMRTSDETELQYLFDRMWRNRFDPADLVHEGTGLYSNGAPAARHKAYREEPNQIDKAAVDLARLRPDLDGVSVELAAAYGWRERWERTLPVMFAESPTSAPAAAGAEPEPTREAVTVPSTVDAELTGGDEDPVGAMAAAAEEMAAAVAAVRVAAEQAEAAAGDDQPRPAAPEPMASDPRERVRQIVGEHPGGIGPSAVHRQLQAEGHRTVLQTVTQWMRADLLAGFLAQPGGERAPYVPGPRMGGGS